MKKISFVFKAILISVFMVSLFGCTQEELAQLENNIVKKPAQDPTSIVTQYSYIPLENSKTYDLSATVIPMEKSSEPLEYSTDNKSVADVDSKGVITAYGNGIAKIKVNLKNDKSIFKNILVNSYTMSDEIKNSTIRAVYLNKTYISLNDNTSEAYKIDASIRPIDAVSELAYLSTDDSVATVSSEGVISTKNTGTASIIVYAKNNPAKYAHLSVEVIESTSSNDNDSSFTPPAGVKPIDLNADPFSLIAKYQILDYSIDGGEKVVVSDDSNLRVNVNLDGLATGIVKILMYVKLNGKEVRLIQQKNINDYGSIPDIFTSLGAKITGDYTMEFTLDPVNYTEFSKQGLINKGETLVLNIGKLESLVPAGGLGSDIVFDVESGDGEQGGDEGSEPETGNEVTKIVLDKYTYTPYAVNEKFKITATVEPATADNKTITWESSNQEVASVNANGEVTVLKNGTATITAKASNGVKAELQIVPVTTPEDFMLEVDKQDLILGVIDTFQITPILYPYILDMQNVEVTYQVQDENIASVSETGLVTALAEGETIVNVTIAGIQRQCYINVLPKSAANVPVERIVLESDNGTYQYAAGSFRLNATVEPATAGDKRLKYEVADTNICEINNTGLVTFKNPGTTTITVSSYSNANVKAVYTIKIQSLPTKIAFDKMDIGIVLNETTSLPLIMEGDKVSAEATYSSSNPTVASVDSKTGVVTAHNLGTTTIKAVTENNLEATYDVHVYTPVDANNINSLVGTYQIIDFEQSNGYLDVSTTAKYGGVERMVGEMTIELDGQNVIIKSKIQMDSSKMHYGIGIPSIAGNAAKVMAAKGQFQYIEYTPYAYNKNGFGIGGKYSAQVFFENGNLKLYQTWPESIATVNVYTWIKKKSNTVKDLQSNKFHFYTSDKSGTKKANAVTYYPEILKPDKEPYYTYGLIAK